MDELIGLYGLLCVIIIKDIFLIFSWFVINKVSAFETLTHLCFHYDQKGLCVAYLALIDNSYVIFICIILL